MTRTLLALLVLILANTAHAQTPPTQIVLDDGTILIGKINQNIEVQTKFGKLTIPPQDILSAHLGYNLTDEETKEVTKAFKDLDSSSFKERDAASRLLKNIGDRALVLMPKQYGGGNGGSAIPMPSAETDPKDPTLESKRRTEQWLKETKPDPKYLHDYFNTDDSTIKGKITNKQITVQHAILGDLKVDVARIKSINSHGNLHTTVNTDEDWKEVCTLHGSRLTISADGTIDLWPQQPGQYNTTPKGYTTAGKGGTFMAGALIGKLDNGQPFFIGDSYTISGSGKLYLRIVENPWNAKSQGSYNIKMERR